MWVNYNPNPIAARVIDCSIRALCKVTGKDWQDVYLEVAMLGFQMCDMPSSNNVWGRYLQKNGFVRRLVPDRCPECYTVATLAADLPEGRYVLALSGHVVAVVSGCYYDTWDSGDETPIYYWEKRSI